MAGWITTILNGHPILPMHKPSVIVIVSSLILHFGICLQLANSLYPLLEEIKPLESALEQFQYDYQQQSQTMMADKLGLREFVETDQALFAELESIMVSEEVDMTLFYRCLAMHEVPSYESLKEAFYTPQAHSTDYIEKWNTWLGKYCQRLATDQQPFQERQGLMNKVNPKYVFRNYLAQQAIDKAEQGDYAMVQELLEVFRKPYDEQSEKQYYASKRPDWAKNKVGCSMLSCSS